MARKAAEQAYAMAGIGSGDIDGAEVQRLLLNLGNRAIRNPRLRRARRERAVDCKRRNVSPFRPFARQRWRRFDRRRPSRRCDRCAEGCAAFTQLTGKAARARSTAQSVFLPATSAAASGRVLWWSGKRFSDWRRRRSGAIFSRGEIWRIARCINREFPRRFQAPRRERF